MSVSKFLKKIFDFFRKQKIGGCAGGQKVRVIGVAMVKNEADIIELFIKINSRFFHEIHILDHRSTDYTAKIIKSMQDLGYPVKYILLENESGDYNQAEITTSYVQKVAREVECDYIMPIDADEFPHLNPNQSLNKTLGDATRESGYCLIPWVTYCPINDGYLKGPAPLYENFRARSAEPSQYYKVILTRNLGRTAKLCTGNHDIAGTNLVKPKKIKAILQHVPVRSAEQIISKAIIGSAALKLTKNHKKGETFHWDEMAKKITEKGMKLSYEDVLEIALNYAKLNDRKPASKIAVLTTCPRIGTAHDTIDLKDLAEIDAQKNIEEFRRATSHR